MNTTTITIYVSFSSLDAILKHLDLIEDNLQSNNLTEPHIIQEEILYCTDERDTVWSGVILQVNVRVFIIFDILHKDYLKSIK